MSLIVFLSMDSVQNAAAWGQEPSDAAPQEAADVPIVWFVHGMISLRDKFEEEIETLKNIYPTAQSVELKTWDAPKMNLTQFGVCWSVSLVNSLKAPEPLAEEIASLPESDRKRLILVGHSLGARIVLKTAAICKQKGIKVRQIILAGAALNNDDPDVPALLDVSREKVINLINPCDALLAAYKQAEGAAALGTAYLFPLDQKRFVEILIPDTIYHYGYVYFNHFQKCVESNDYSNAEIVVPQDYSQLDMPTLGGKIWWDVLDSCQGWRLQHSQATGYCRILDPSGFRRAWGRQYRMEAAFKRVRQQLEAPQPILTATKEGVVTKEIKPVPEQDIDVQQNYYNWTRSTEGGKTFWNELDKYRDWKLQQNIFTGHCRILDPSNVRRAWGSQEKMRQSFDKVKQDLQARESR